MSKAIPAPSTTCRLAVASASALAVFIVCLFAGPAPAGAETPLLVDESTPAYYNDAIGRVLDGTGPQFPRADMKGGDPLAPHLEEPDLQAAAGVLGFWLGAQPPAGGAWKGPQPIPKVWAVNSETAIVYEIDGGTTGIKNVTAKFGIDNGIFVWVSGQYKFGAMAPGGLAAAEYKVPLGDLPPGLTYIQVLREDHGDLTAYTVSIGAP
jgi:hypothetical protein